MTRLSLFIIFFLLPSFVLSFSNQIKAKPYGTNTNASQIVLTEDFEDNVLDSCVSIITLGSFSSYPGIKDVTNFGSSKAFGFGLSTCGSNCFNSYTSRLVIKLEEPTYLLHISFKEMELYSNWGSAGHLLIDGFSIDNAFSRYPYNDWQADNAFRQQDYDINKLASQIEFKTVDITNRSEVFVDDLVVYGFSADDSLLNAKIFFIYPDTIALDIDESQPLNAFSISVDGYITAKSADWQVLSLNEIGKTRLIGSLSDFSGTKSTLHATCIGDGRIIARSGENADTAWVCVKGLPGDVTADSLVMANDASQTLRAAIGLDLAPIPPGHARLTLYERYAADYNQNNLINVDDAKLILDKSLEGLLRKTMVQPGSGPAVVSLGSGKGAANGRFVLPLYVRLRKDIGAARLVLCFNEKAFSLCDIATTTSGSFLLRNDLAPGKVILGLIHSESLVNDGEEFLQLHFKNHGKADDVNVAIDSIELFDCQAKPVNALIEVNDHSTPVILQEFSLEQNYPNPFNPTTTVCCQLPRESHVRLTIYNASGQMVKTLFAGFRPAGESLATWDGCDETGQNLSSGVYFCRLDIDQGTHFQSIKLVLMR